MKTIVTAVQSGRRAAALAITLAVIATFAACEASTTDPAGQAVMRCGWFDNPTPGNAWLYDRDGDWTIGIQGGHRARGEWPRFKASEWVLTGHGSAGYGCACIKVITDAETREVTTILSARAKPLRACRQDTAIKGKEPENPLK